MVTRFEGKKTPNSPGKGKHTRRSGRKTSIIYPNNREGKLKNPKKIQTHLKLGEPIEELRV